MAFRGRGGAVWSGYVRDQSISDPFWSYRLCHSNSLPQVWSSLLVEVLLKRGTSDHLGCRIDRIIRANWLPQNSPPIDTHNIIQVGTVDIIHLLGAHGPAMFAINLVRARTIAVTLSCVVSESFFRSFYSYTVSLHMSSSSAPFSARCYLCYWSITSRALRMTWSWPAASLSLNHLPNLHYYVLVLNIITTN